MKKIISFSLWGNNPKYLIGAVENAKLKESIYPDWTCRFYVDTTVPAQTLAALTDLGSEIVYKSISDGYFGLFWRFEPGFDSHIERFIVRDCDSRINIREAAAVKEWEKSELPFHAMRDHPGHGIPILGAMWGATSFFLPDFKDLYNQFIFQIKLNSTVVKRNKFFYTDQTFLSNFIWPRIKDNCIVHDDNARITGTEKSFLVKLSDNQFVGQQWGADNKPLTIPL